MLKHLPDSAPASVPLSLGGAGLETLIQPRLSLFWGAHTPTRALLTLVAALAGRGYAPRIYDGGNRFDGYYIARLARRVSVRPQELLERIRLSRAFTCFQLAELIENTPADPEPLIVLDLLTTFYDESVPLREVERLLDTSLAHLRRLAACGPVIIGAREPRAPVRARWSLLERLQIAADAAWMLQLPVEGRNAQLSLF
ncbi:MAG: hypothetical protein JXA97_03030 [Anaerolineales bacterium]|nr:hypothetical protein [Anaerolineales bacterium]